MTNSISSVIPATYNQWMGATVPVAKFQLAYESDTDKFKIGDGVTLYANLPYILSHAGNLNSTYPLANAISTSLGVLTSAVYNPIGWGATGSQQTTMNSTTLAIGSTVIPVMSVMDFAVGNGIYIAGASLNGTPLISTVQAVDPIHQTITITNQTQTALNNPATFPVYFNGNTVTLVAVPANPIYPGCILTHGSTVATILALQSGTANQVGAVYTTNNMITNFPGSVLVGVTYLIQHDDTVAINNCLLAVSNNSTGISAIHFGGVTNNVSSPIIGQSNTLMQNFSFILAPGTQGNFCSIINWQNYTNYVVGQQVFSNGNQYICTQAGISAFTSGQSGTGISGIGTSIVDNTVLWNYVGQAQNTTAVLTYGNTFNSMTEYGQIDINRQPVLGFTTGGASGIVHLRMFVRHWITGYHGYYLQGKTITYFCSATQYTSSDWETNFPTQYYSGSGYFYDVQTVNGSGTQGGGTDSFSFQCTAAGGGADGLFHIAAGITHGRLISPHPFSANGSGVSLTRTNYNNWSANTSYSIGNKVVNGSFVYICTFGGISQVNGSGPIGTFNGQTDGSVTWNYFAPVGNGAWAANTAYTVGNKVSNNGQTYKAIIAGTSGTTGPTGIGIYNTFKATNCSVAGNTLTVGGVVTTPYTVPLTTNMSIIVPGLPTGTLITGFLTGTNGGAGTYSISSTVGNISNLTLTSFDIPDGSVIWSYQGTAPVINPVNILIQGNGVLVSGCYLDTGMIVIHAIKSNGLSIVIENTDSLNNTGPAQLSSWINVIAGLPNTSMKYLQISPMNNWTGNLQILNQQTVGLGSFLNFTNNYASQLLTSTSCSLMTTTTGLTLLETNPNTNNILQIVSTYINAAGIGQSYAQFVDPLTTASSPPRIGSNGNDLIGTAGSNLLRLSNANKNVVLGASTGLETFSSHLALSVASQNPTMILEHTDTTHPQGLGIYFSNGTFTNKSDAAIALLDQSGIIVSYNSANVGNGTIGSIVLGNMNNHTYNIIATSSTTFNVVDGTINSSIGTATIGTLFVSNSISFMITAGSTAFAVGDKCIITISYKTAIWSDGSIEHPTLNYQVSDFGSIICSNLSGQVYQIASGSGNGGYISGVYDLFWASTGHKQHMRVAVGITNNSDTTPSVAVFFNWDKSGLGVISNPTLALDSSGNVYFVVTVTPNVSGTLLVQARGYSTALALSATPGGSLPTIGPINSIGGRIITTSGSILPTDSNTVVAINNGSSSVTITLPATFGNFAADICVLGTGVVNFVLGTNAYLNGVQNSNLSVTNSSGQMLSFRLSMQYNPDGLSARWFIK